jgi:site-specific DNA-methyltransferase (adenine-specific)
MARKKQPPKKRPGQVRDAIIRVLAEAGRALSTREIQIGVSSILGSTAESSVRSYLRLNSQDFFVRTGRGTYALADEVHEVDPQSSYSASAATRSFVFGKATLLEADCFDWLRLRNEESIHAVVTDPPYGLVEYQPDQQKKLRDRRGGVWRIPPSFDGAKRSPLPRFTVLRDSELQALEAFFYEWGRILLPVLVPGANVVVASNPLLSYLVSGALARAGLERRGEIVRLVMTMRGGDRPKAAHQEFPHVSVMPRSMWEPWLVFRKPIEGRIQDNLRRWKTGGFRRPSDERPFGDVLSSSPTHSAERALAPHPSLKPQLFLRQIVRGALPLGEGVILDPFCGAASTLAAAEAVGYSSIGLEKDPHYFDIAKRALPKLAAFKNGDNYSLDL